MLGIAFMQYLDDNSAGSAHFTLEVKMNQLDVEVLIKRLVGLMRRGLSCPTLCHFTTARKTGFLHKCNPSFTWDLQCLLPPLSKEGKIQQNQHFFNQK